MHSPVILLTKANNRTEARNNAESFMEDYYMDAYDWYAIGNRWHNTLAPEDKLKEFEKWVREEYKDVFENGMYSINDLENEKDRAKIQKKWEDLGLKGKNTFYSSYGFDVTDTEDDYNIVPLSSCLNTVQEWCRDLKNSAEKNFKKLVEQKEKESLDESGFKMSSYYAEKYAKDVNGDFNFDSCVYNIDDYEAEQIPNDVKNYWAVMIDMHN